MTPSPHGDPAAPSGPCGFLVVDKPAGITSHGCVAAVRRAYGLRRVGHGGTLDPAVTGVLPIAIGPATRLLPYLTGTKAYVGVIQLGLRSSSDDMDGTVLDRQPPPALGLEALDAALQRFRGPILQIPPQVSAVHVEGERAYARARRGETVALQPRPVTIEQLQLLAWDPASGRLELAVRCSAGTYIRALARDLGETLGCGGALAWLRRTEALGFDLSAAVPLDRLAAPPAPPLVDPIRALGHLAQYRLNQAELLDWRCGRRLQGDRVSEDLPLPDDRPSPGDEPTDPVAVIAPAGDPVGPVAVIAPDGRLAGIAQRSPEGDLRPRLVFDAAG